MTKPERWTQKIERIEFDGVPGIGSGEVLIRSPLTVLSGPNGSGKSTVLAVAFATMAPKLASREDLVTRKLSSGSALLEFTFDNAKGQRQATFGIGEVSSETEDLEEVVFIDPASALARQKRLWKGNPSLADVTNGEAMRPVEGERLSELNYITRRDYRRIEVTEVEVDDDVLPVFEVTYGDYTYDSRSMGMGELSAFSTWWAVDRAVRRSWLVIEEPETFLSPISQAAIGDYIMSRVVEKAHACLMTSHSAPIITAVPNTSIVFFGRGASGINVKTSLPHPRQLASIGIESRLRGLLFVEDSLGRTLLRAILDRLAPTLSGSILISIRGGDGGITQSLRNIGDEDGLRFGGVYDGDLRGASPADLLERSAFLAESEPMESVFRRLLVAQPDALTDNFGLKDPAELLGALEGADHHDWYSGLARELGVSDEVIAQFLTALWFKQEGRSELAAQTLHSVLAVLKL